MPFDIQSARERFALAKQAWGEIYDEYHQDIRIVSGNQWEDNVKAARDAAQRPALTFNRCHTLVQQVTNQTRQNPARPKVNPAGGGARVETAQVYEGILRHIDYASQASTAREHAAECCASGGLGFYRISTEYIADGSFDQEPRIRRILDPTTVLFDPAVEEPDFSDANFAAVRKRVRRGDYHSEVGQEPIPFGDDAPEGWADKDYIWVAEWWQVERIPRTLLALADGSTAYSDQFSDEQFDQIKPLIRSDRKELKRQVTQDIIDGYRSLETNQWLGKWIPIIPVLGKEMIVDGKRQLHSLIRQSRDPQKLLNAYKSGIAEQLALSSRAPYTGPKGTFKDSKWRNANTANYAYLEYELVVGPNGQLAAPPQRNTYEAPIQALSAAAMQEADDIKASAGYVDSILQPSQAKLSGVAVSRRDNQRDLTNFHFSDNLSRAMWHEGRILLDLIPKVIDTPRAIRILGEDGQASVVAVTMALEGGQPQMVPGVKPEDHHRLDVGRYDLTVTTAPSYSTKQEEERDILLQMAQSNPATWQLYGDLVFKAMGYPDLEERAKLGLAPQVQAAMKSDQQGVPPQVQAQLAQLTQQNQQLSMQLKEMLLEKKAKLIEAETKVRVALINASTDVTVQGMKGDHEAKLALFQGQMTAVDKMLSMLHESEMAPDPADAQTALQGQPAQGPPVQ